jgi:hypothetical protein
MPGAIPPPQYAFMVRCSVKADGQLYLHLYLTFNIWDYVAPKEKGIPVCIQKFPDLVDKEIDAYILYYSLWSNSKGYGTITNYTDSQNSDATAPSGRAIKYAVLAPGSHSGNFWMHSLLLVNSELLRIWRAPAVANFKVPSQHSPRKTEERFEPGTCQIRI